MAASAYQVGSLAAYTKDEANQLLIDFIYSETDTLKIPGINKWPGIKSAQRVNKVVIDPIWQAQACNWNPSGDTTFSQVTLTVGDVAVMLDWCEKDLEPKYIQEEMKAGSKLDMLTYREIFLKEILQQVNMRREEAAWLGDTASGSTFLSQYDGLIKKIAAASGILTYSGTAWSVGNARTVVNGIVNKLATDNADAFSRGKFELFMSPRTAYDYRQKLINDNLYHNDGKGELREEILGTKINVVQGLKNRYGYIFAIEPDNIHYGFDADEANKFDLYWAQEARKIRFIAEWKEGWAVQTGGRIVQYLAV